MAQQHAARACGAGVERAGRGVERAHVRLWGRGCQAANARDGSVQKARELSAHLGRLRLSPYWRTVAPLNLPRGCPLKRPSRAVYDGAAVYDGGC
jgi:hypothetical protein